MTYVSALIALSVFAASTTVFAQQERRSWQPNRYPGLQCRLFIQGMHGEKSDKYPETTLQRTELDKLPQVIKDEGSAPYAAKTLTFAGDISATVTVPMMPKYTLPTDYRIIIEVKRNGVTYATNGSGGEAFLQVEEKGKFPEYDDLAVNVGCDILY
jgi:hypothetical protein